MLRMPRAWLGGERRYAFIETTQYERDTVDMLTLAVIFFILAIVAGLLGFGYIAFAAAGIAKILFVIFLVLFVASLILRIADKADRVVDRNL